MWMFGTFVDPRLAAGLGLVFIAGRFVYLRLYVQEPAKRGPGVLITLLAQAILMLGGTIGAAVAWLG